MEYHTLGVLPWLTGTFWVMLSVVAFVALFGKKIAMPVAAMLDARGATVRTALEEAAALKAEAETMLADAQARHAQAMADAQHILSVAHEEAVKMAADLAGQAQATAARRERMALERIAAAEKAAIDDVRRIAIDVATEAATHMLGDGFAAEHDSAMVDYAIAGLPSALRQAV